MKKLFLYTPLLTLLVFSNILSNIIKPEEDPIYIEGTKQINKQAALIKSLEEALTQSIIDGSGNRSTIKEVLNESRNLLSKFISIRNQLYKKLKAEYDSAVKA